jgi:hypothetical protein
VKELQDTYDDFADRQQSIDAEYHRIYSKGGTGGGEVAPLSPAAKQYLQGLSTPNPAPTPVQ